MLDDNLIRVLYSVRLYGVILDDDPPLVTVRVPPEVSAELDRIARQHGLSKSELLRISFRVLVKLVNIAEPNLRDAEKDNGVVVEAGSREEAEGTLAYSL